MYRNNSYTVDFDHPINTFNKYTGKGAAAGYKMGGPWGMLWGAIAGSVVGSALGHLNARETWKEFRSKYKAADAQNKSVLQELGRNLSEISRQRAILAMETQSALAYVKSKSDESSAEVRNTFASADVISSGAEALENQILSDRDQQLWVARFNHETQNFNLNVNAQNLLNAADAQFVGVNVNRKRFDWAQAISDAAEAFGSIAGDMASSKGKGAGAKGGDKGAGKDFMAGILDQTKFGEGSSSGGFSVSASAMGRSAPIRPTSTYSNRPSRLSGSSIIGLA